MLGSIDDEVKSLGTVLVMFILRTYLPPKHNLLTGLKKIYGINDSIIHQLCQDIGLNPIIPLRFLKPAHIGKLTQWVNDHDLCIKEDLKKIILDRKTHLMTIKAYRGMRHKGGLPTRGQRTHTNRKTQRALGVQFKKDSKKLNKRNESKKLNKRNESKKN